MFKQISHYEIIKKLEEGGFGTTYLAVDTHLPDRPKRVVKHLKIQNTEAKRLFEKEAKVLYNLQHPQIPRLHAYFEEGGYGVVSAIGIILGYGKFLLGFFV